MTVKKKSYLTLKEHREYTDNPFVESALIKIEENTVQKRRFVKGAKGVEQTIVNRDGEVTGHTAFLQIIKADEEKFAKLYLSQFAAFWDLKKASMRVFGYLLSILQPKQDRVFFNMKHAVRYTGYSSNKYVISGLSDLCDHGIIARSDTPYMYFINPLVFFNGDRVTFAKTYVRKRKKKIEEDKQQKKMDFWDDAIESNKAFE